MPRAPLTSRRRRSGRPSGRFVLRIDPGLHVALRRAAAEAGLSLNDYCARKLAAPFGGGNALDDGAAAVARAAELFGRDLVGVLVMGSWARSELADTSDVDLLVVVEARVALARRLYVAWDQAPVDWRGRAVEPHFVHLPDEEQSPTGLWAEAAVDGVVLFERDVAVSTHLVRVRHEIVAGRLVRRIAHGQPYWKVA